MVNYLLNSETITDLKCPCSVDAYEEMLSDNVISKPAKKRLEKLHEDMENHMMRKLEEVIENHRVRVGNYA